MTFRIVLIALSILIGSNAVPANDFSPVAEVAAPTAAEETPSIEVSTEQETTDDFGIYGADAATETMIIGAIRQYGLAGIIIPELRIYVHDSQDPCLGNLGLYGLGQLLRAARPGQRAEALRSFGLLVVAGLLLLAASGLNPFGFRLHFHVVRLLASPELTFPREFQTLEFLSSETWPVLEGLSVLALDALRHRHHPTHLTVGQAQQIAQQIAADRTFLVHMTHDLAHESTEADLVQGIALAYDGLEILS